MIVSIMLEYDLCVAWNWEYDKDFIALLDESCRSNGLSLLQITPENLASGLHALSTKEIICGTFFDRASDLDPQFMPLVQWMHENQIHSINSFDRASLTWDKAQMHSRLVNVGLEVPQTIIIPSYLEQPDLPLPDLLSIGKPFTIKPAHGSGGVGVFTHATSWEQVLTTRQEHTADKYLLQAQIVPKEFDIRPAWFRVIYCFAKIYPCWWDPANHVYAPLTEQEKNFYGLEKLEASVVAISSLCRLDLFSTEIAITQADQFMVVDYVNDQIDLRLQSKAYEGVPDAIVRDITEQLVSQFM